MLELINSSVSWAIIVSGIVFTVYGSTLGLALGYKIYAKHMVDILVREGYVKYRTLEDGEIELIKLNEESK